VTSMSVEVEGRELQVSSLDRVLWPATGTTKAHLLEHYLRVAPLLLPHLRDRPLTLHRFPEGVRGKHFLQTRMPPHPPWLRSVTLSYPRTGKTFEAPVIDDLAGLVRMTKALRVGKVLVDWSQNDPGTSTVAPWSVRGYEVPHGVRARAVGGGGAGGGVAGTEAAAVRAGQRRRPASSGGSPEAAVGVRRARVSGSRCGFSKINPGQASRAGRLRQHLLRPEPRR